MTNREAFNKYLRQEIEEAIKCVENMSNEELVERLRKYPNFQITKEVGHELNYYMYNWFAEHGNGHKPDNWKGLDDWAKWLSLDSESEWKE